MNLKKIKSRIRHLRSILSLSKCLTVKVARLKNHSQLAVPTNLSLINSQRARSMNPQVKMKTNLNYKGVSLLLKIIKQSLLEKIRKLKSLNSRKFCKEARVNLSLNLRNKSWILKAQDKVGKDKKLRICKNHSI